MSLGEVVKFGGLSKLDDMTIGGNRGDALRCSLEVVVSFEARGLKAPRGCLASRVTLLTIDC